MKTVGQLLHSDRLKKNISVDELSLATKIDAKYILALEADNYDLLPSETFTKGFIRNLSLTLGNDPKEYIAVFRRDYKNPIGNINNTPQHKARRYHLPQMSSQILPIFLGVVVFLVYLGIQFRAILIPPPLELNKPQGGSVLSSPVDISGSTSIDSLVTINEENVIKPDQNGNFQISINIPVGESILTVKTTNRFGRSQVSKIPLTIISQ